MDLRRAALVSLVLFATLGAPDVAGAELRLATLTVKGMVCSS
jgi:hypothetical protein